MRIITVLPPLVIALLLLMTPHAALADFQPGWKSPPSSNSIEMIAPADIEFQPFSSAGGSRYLDLARGGPGYKLPGGLSVLISALPSTDKCGGYSGPDIPLDFMSSGRAVHGFSSTLGIIDAERGWSLGLNGSGVTIAVADSGVDLGHPDLYPALDRDQNGEPVMLDADGQGIVLTNNTIELKIVDGRLVSSKTMGVGLLLNSTGAYLNFGKGYNITVYNSFYPLAGPLMLKARLLGVWRIGKSATKYIPTSSGVYHVGVMAEAMVIERKGSEVGILMLIPAILTDPKGRYDTVYADLSDIYKALIGFLNGTRAHFDLDFYDEKPATVGVDERLIYDVDGDGTPEFSAGAIGTWVLDVWGVLSGPREKVRYLGELRVGHLLPPVSMDGSYFTVMYDFYGHGTSVAALALGRDTQNYDLYSNGTRYRLPGVAPAAKLIPVKTLWLGDVPYAWLWSTGFEYRNGGWRYTGRHRAQVIVNSWGISEWPLLDSLPGLDPISLLASSLSIPGSISGGYPGTVMVVAAGNGGPGEGTVDPPASSPYTIAVGASTDMSWVNSVDRDLWRGYRPARAGGTSRYGDSIAYWSSRGPSLIGWPKPDIVAPGMYGFAPSRVLPNQKGSTRAYSIFGGTSMSAPLVAGAVAIAIQGLKRGGSSGPMTLLKARLLTVESAHDLGLSVEYQGSGRLDIGRMLDLLGSRLPEVESNSTRIPKMLSKAAERWGIEGRWDYPFPLTSLAIYYNDTGLVVAPLHAFSKIEKSTEIAGYSRGYRGRTVLNVNDPLLGKKGGNIPRYVKQDAMRIVVPADASWAQLILSMPFTEFRQKGLRYMDNVSWTSLFVYDWVDANKDDIVWYNETSLISYSARVSNFQEVLLPLPSSKPRGQLLMGVYEGRRTYSYWSGEPAGTAPHLKFTVNVTFYRWKGTGLAALSKANRSISVSPRWHMMKPGIHTFKLVVKLGNVDVVLPISISKPFKPSEPLSVMRLGPFRCTFDASWRYETGGWMSIPLLADPNMGGLAMRASWTGNDTFASLFLASWNGALLASTVRPGALEELYGWPSVDWIGPGRLGSGAYMNPYNASEARMASSPLDHGWLVVHVPEVEEPSAGASINLIVRRAYLRPDVSPPKIEISKIPGIISKPIVIRIAVLDESSVRSRLLIDGTPFTSFGHGANVTLDPHVLADGNHTLSVMAEDSAGWRSDYSAMFTVDTRPPRMHLLMPRGIASGMVKIPFSVTDMSPFRIDVSKPAEVVGNAIILDTRLLPDGPYELKISARDAAGNVAKRTSTLIVDNTPPTLTLSIPRMENVTGILTINVTVADEHLVHYTISLDGAPVNTTEIDTRSLADGNHTLSVMAEDSAGNKAIKRVMFTTVNHSLELREAMSRGLTRGIEIGVVIAVAVALTSSMICLRRIRRSRIGEGNPK